MKRCASSRGIFSRSARPKSRKPVGDPVVDHLGDAADVRRHVLRLHPQHPCGGRQVDVRVRGEVGLQPRVAGDVRQDAQLLLRVVGAQQQLARRRHERAADATAQCGTDRDVLQVRIDARQPPGGGHRLLVGGVQPAIAAHQARQRVDVRPLQLRDLAVLQDQANRLVLVAQLFQDRCVRRVAGPRPLRARQAKLVEQDLLQLLG